MCWDFTLILMVRDVADYFYAEDKAFNCLQISSSHFPPTWIGTSYNCWDTWDWNGKYFSEDFHRSDDTNELVGYYITE